MIGYCLHNKQVFRFDYMLYCRIAPSSGIVWRFHQITTHKVCQIKWSPNPTTTIAVARKQLNINKWLVSTLSNFEWPTSDQAHTQNILKWKQSSDSDHIYSTFPSQPSECVGPCVVVSYRKKLFLMKMHMFAMCKLWWCQSHFTLTAPIREKEC